MVPLIVLYDFSLAVNALCNLARSVGTLSFFLHVLGVRSQVYVIVFCDIVAIGYELRLSAKFFLATVHAVVSSRS